MANPNERVPGRERLVAALQHRKPSRSLSEALPFLDHDLEIVLGARRVHGQVVDWRQDETLGPEGAEGGPHRLAHVLL